MAATGAGWAALPINLSFGDAIKGLQKELSGPVAKAAKQAGDSLENGIGKGADQAAKQVEKAQYRVKKSTQELEDAESKYRAEKLKQEAADKALEASAKELAAAREKGGAAAERAEEKFLKAQARSETASNNARKAHDKLKDAQEESAKAAKKLEDQLEELEHAESNAADEAEDSRSVFKRLGDSMREAANDADDMGGKFRGGLGLGAVAGVAASLTSEVVGSFSDLVSGATEASDATDKFKSTLDFAGLDTSTIEQVTAQAQKYADQTVYDLGDIQNMTAQLAANGVDNYAGLAEAAGNLNAIAGGNADTFKSVGMVMSQTAGAGKLTTENWNQLADAIPGASGKVQEALEQAGAYTGNFRDAMANGEITAEEFNAAVMELGNEPVAVEAAKSTQTFEGMLGNLQATIQGGLANAFTELKPYIETFVNGLSGLAEKYLPVMVEGIKDGIEKLKTFGEWVQKNRDWLEPLGVALGVMAGGLAAVSAATTAWTTATRVYSTVQKIATGELKLFNLALKTNVIGLVVTAVAALVAGLVYFFTKTETGREMWEKFTEALGKSIDWIGEKWNQFTGWLSDGWNTIKTGVIDAWNAYWTDVQANWAILTGALTAAWDMVKDGLSSSWNWIKTTVIDAWNTYWANVRANFDILKNALIAAWTFVRDTFTNVWNAIKTAVVDAFVNAFNMLRGAFTVVTGALAAAWTWLKDTLASVWNTIRDAVFTAFNNAIENVRNIFDRVTGAISGAWTWLKDQLHAGWTWIKENVFDAIGRGLDQVKGWFQAGVDGIRDIWDGLKAAAARPVKFVIDTVWNKGILAAWNSIADFLPGIDAKDPISLGDLGGYATGGVLPGWSPGRDIHEFVSPTGGRIHLSGGEAIMRPEWTRAVGGPAAVERMNRDARTGKLGKQKLSDEERKELRQAHALGGIISIPSQAFANGGVVDAMINIVHKKYPQMILTSGYRNSNDNHGRGLAADFAWPGAFGPHPAQLALANDIATTYPNSMELIYGPGFSRQIKNGQIVGDGGGSFGFYAGAGDHSNHVHWAMDTPPTMPFGGGVFEGGSSGGGGGGLGGWIASKAKEIWDKIVKPIKSGVDKIAGELGGSEFGKIPGAAFEKIEKAAWGKISSLLGGGAGFGSVDLSGIAGDNRQIVQEVFKRYGWTGQQWADAEWIIMKESGFNNTAQNPTSTAYGMFQFLDTTWDDVGGSKTSDPKLQADYGAKYIQSRYGDPTKARRFWEANGWYANGGVLPGFTPGRDVHRFFSPTGGMLALSGGEAIMRPEWTRAVGGAGAVNSMNRAAMRGGSGVLPGGDAFEVLKEAAQHLDNAAKELGLYETARKSAEDYAADSGSTILSTMGLEGLIGIGQTLGTRALEAYQADPWTAGVTGDGVWAASAGRRISASANGRGATIVIEAESDEDLVRAGQLRELAGRVNGVEVELRKPRRPKASVMTKGGVM